jgi:rSAM/selenodomain-associated transferase 1
MVKLPRPGRVKTRLARALGTTGAAWWYRHQVSTLTRRLQDPRWRLVLAVSPDHEGLKSRVWPSHIDRIPQRGGDLGARMACALSLSGPGPVCVIGSDIPRIRPSHIARAFGMLGRFEAVLGPAPDGGYWLVGLKRTRPVPPGLFADVRWSTQHALSDTLATMANLRVGFADTLQDVDDLSDLRMTAQNPRATSGA